MKCLKHFEVKYLIVHL